MGSWGDFLRDMHRLYGVSLESLNDEFRQEQQDYFMSTSAWADIHPSQLLGPPACFKHYDLLTVTLEEIAAPLQVCSLLPSCIASMHNAFLQWLVSLKTLWLLQRIASIETCFATAKAAASVCKGT